MNRKEKHVGVIRNIVVTIGSLVVDFLLCLLIQNIFSAAALVPAIVVLGVFLIAVFTDGYSYGVLASICSVLVLNYAFTFPYFKINFTIPENIISAVIMVAVTLITCFLTSKIKYQESLKAESEKEKMRANLLRAVSHDLRTPLTTIYGSSSAMLENEETLTREQKQQMLLGIQQDSQWLCRMVENLLSITRLDGSHVQIIKVPTVLDELIDSVLVKFNKHYAAYEVSVDIPDEMVVIPMDPILIEQVMSNLLENAVLHGTGLTQIWLKVFTIQNQAIFEIRDDGCGIASEKMKNLFNGNYMSEEETTDRQKGNAGIGLSVCATIIRAHGGDITVENSKDGGVIFRFNLDLGEDDEHEESV